MPAHSLRGQRMSNVHALPTLLSERQAAEALGVSIDTVRRARQRGEIRASFIGRRWKYRAEWIEDFIDRRALQWQGEGETAFRSAPTGCPAAPAPPPGTAPGSIRRPARPAEPPLAQTISRPPSSPSPPGSRPMGSCATPRRRR
ncbi:helix-turn-helix domain-containing protein [Aquibaculum sediminis]|uniref:helix-turn-helix domain-containing protein n=1 Tax=Aquibaculum sediminis TaxID=3231907 RepID=UPI0034529D5C